MGTCQWFALLARPFFAIFRHVYAFTRTEPLDVAIQIPSSVPAELCLFSALAPLLVADLARDYVPSIVASDAAPEFGFGVASAPATQDLLQELGRLAEHRGDYISLAEHRGDLEAEAEKPRLGKAHRLALRRCDFSHILSVRARREEHSGVLELNAALLLYKWLARAPRHHGKRVLTLLDAKAIIGGIQKGRSSSRSLGRLLQRLGAYLLACNFLPRLLYVPSEDMPADAPSRGVRKRPQCRRVLKPRGFAKIDRKMHRAFQQHERAFRAFQRTHGADLFDSSAPTSLTSSSA